MRKLILFDLDGTLTDSGPGIKECMRYALIKMGFAEHAERDLGFFVGPPLVDGMKEFTGCSQEVADETVRIFREKYNVDGIFNNAPYTGMHALLRDLKAEDCVLGVASSKPESMVVRVLEHFGLLQYFDFLAGASEDERHGDKAAIMERVINEAGYRRNRADVIMVGDRKYDVYGSGKCGVTCVGVSYGYGTWEELEEAGADYLADSVPGLENCLLTLIRRDEGAGSGRAERHPATRNMSGGAKAWDIFFPIVFYLVATVAAAVIAGLIAVLAFGGGAAAAAHGLMPYMMQVAFWSTVGANIFLVLFLWRVKRRDDVRFADPMEHRWEWPQVILGAVMMAAIAHLLNIAIDISGLENIFPGYAESMAGLFESLSPVVIILHAVLLAPIAEELVFRGLFYRRLKAHLGIGWAIGISSAVFGAVHGNVIQFVYATLLGIFLALIYERSRTLAAPILAHMLANAWALFSEGFLRVVLPSGNGAKTIFLAAEGALALVCFVFLIARKKKA